MFMETLVANRDVVWCEDGHNIYIIPKTTFARVVLELNIPGAKYVRYKTGAQIYDMSERQFRLLAKNAGAVYKINRMVLVNLEIIDQYLEYFREA
jgi:hypothetical protein